MSKKVLKVLCSIFIIMSSFVPVKALSTNNSGIVIKDLDTKELIINSQVELVVAECNEIIDTCTDENGIINLDSNIYEKIKNSAIYISVKGNYNGELCTNIQDNVLYVKRNKTKGAGDWNTISTTIEEYIWVPLTKVPTAGGLDAEFKLGQSSDWSLSGGIFTQMSYNEVNYTGSSVKYYCPLSTASAWMNIFIKVPKIKLIQQTVAGTQRTIYYVSNKAISMKAEGVKTTFSKTITPDYIFEKGQRSTHTFGRIKSFSLQVTGAYGALTGTLSGGNTNETCCTYSSESLDYYYYFNYDKVNRSVNELF